MVRDAMSRTVFVKTENEYESIFRPVFCILDLIGPGTVFSESCAGSFGEFILGFRGVRLYRGHRTGTCTTHGHLAGERIFKNRPEKSRFG